MKKPLFMWVVLVLLVSILFSCGMSTESLARQVQESMTREYLKDDSNFKFRKDLTLIKRSGNEFVSIAEVTLRGMDIRLSIEVISDNKSFKWSAEPIR